MEKQKEFELAIQEVIKTFVPKLFLEQFTFDLHSGCESKAALYECKYNYPYLNASIGYSEKAYDNWAEGKDISPFVLHEMCHLLTDPFYSKAVSVYRSKDEIEDERERLTDWICNIVLRK